MFLLPLTLAPSLSPPLSLQHSLSSCCHLQLSSLCTVQSTVSWGTRHGGSAFAFRLHISWRCVSCPMKQSHWRILDELGLCRQSALCRDCTMQHVCRNHLATLWKNRMKWKRRHSKEYYVYVGCAAGISNLLEIMIVKVMAYMKKGYFNNY